MSEAPVGDLHLLVIPDPKNTVLADETLYRGRSTVERETSMIFRHPRSNPILIFSMLLPVPGCNSPRDLCCI